MTDETMPSERANPAYLRMVAHSLARAPHDRVTGFITMSARSRDGLVKDLRAAAAALSVLSGSDEGEG